jgi:hypothetical protein
MIREQETPEPQAKYNSEHQRLVAIAQGFNFNTHNGQVFNHLQSWTLEGPAWTWMHQFSNSQNSRAAWQELLFHYNGDAEKDRVKDTTYSAIHHATYHGAQERFSFKAYVTIHQGAYAHLVQYNKPIPEDKRVHNLLQGIKDPTSQAAKQMILASPQLRTNFDATVTHLAMSLQLTATLQDNQNISALGNNAGSGRGTDATKPGVEAMATMQAVEVEDVGKTYT